MSLDMTDDEDGKDDYFLWRLTVSRYLFGHVAYGLVIC
jgi:hypothetical protein